MKQLTSMLIIPLAIGLVVTYFAFNLNKEFVDLRYTISEKIPTKYFESSAAETVQQLVVKNNGNVPAEKVQIKINGEIVEYDILKNSLSDKVEEHYKNGHFEAVYPSLPPSAQFSYIFKTSGVGLNKSLIEITHNKGKGAEALTSDGASTEKASSLTALALSIFYFVLIAIQFRSMAIGRLESRGDFERYSEYLNKSKPFYVSQEKWNLIRTRYIEKMSKVDYFNTSNVEDLESYKALNQSIPSYLSVDEWELLKEKSTKCVVDFLSYSIKTSSQYDDQSKYLTIKKPVHFSNVQWGGVVKAINENFIASKKLNERFYLSHKDFIKELNAGMHDGMLPVYWEEYKEYLLKRYYEVTYVEIVRERDPVSFLREVDLSVLEKEKQNYLKDFAYKIQLTNFKSISSSFDAENFLKGEKPEWMKSEDLARFINVAQKFMDLEKSVAKYRFFLAALYNIAHKIPLKEKSDDTIEDKDWIYIKDLESKISTVAIKIEEDKVELEISKNETKELKNKILRQLDIVNNIFSDPNSIERIEPYDNPFSKGNFESLQKISNSLKSIKKTL